MTPLPIVSNRPLSAASSTISSVCGIVLCNYSQIYDDRYFSQDNGFEESKSVFVCTNKILEKVVLNPNLKIGELGFGTGLNLLATLDCIEKSELETCEISFYSVEKYPLPPQTINGIIGEFSHDNPEFFARFLENYDKLFADFKNGFNSAVWNFGKIKVNFNLYFGDVLEFLDGLDGEIDSWYLDGHSPEKNPEMWSEAVCKKLYRKSKYGTTAATYTASGAVKKNLRAAGFFVKRQKGFGTKRHKLQIWRY